MFLVLKWANFVYGDRLRRGILCVRTGDFSIGSCVPLFTLFTLSCFLFKVAQAASLGLGLAF